MAASEISFSDKSPRAQANAQHQRPLFGPSFEGEARGDREPAAPMRAVEEVESRPADGPGQVNAFIHSFMKNSSETKTIK